MSTSAVTPRLCSRGCDGALQREDDLRDREREQDQRDPVAGPPHDPDERRGHRPRDQQPELQPVRDRIDEVVARGEEENRADGRRAAGDRDRGACARAREDGPQRGSCRDGAWPCDGGGQARPSGGRCAASLNPWRPGRVHLPATVLRGGCRVAPVPIAVALADDSAPVRDGLRRVLERRPGIRVVASCEDLDSLLEAADRLRPDVVLTRPAHAADGDRRGDPGRRRGWAAPIPGSACSCSARRPSRSTPRRCSPPARAGAATCSRSARTTARAWRRRSTRSAPDGACSTRRSSPPSSTAPRRPAARRPRPARAGGARARRGGEWGAPSLAGADARLVAAVLQALGVVPGGGRRRARQERRARPLRVGRFIPTWGDARARAAPSASRA